MMAIVKENISDCLFEIGFSTFESEKNIGETGEIIMTWVSERYGAMCVMKTNPKTTTEINKKNRTKKIIEVSRPSKIILPLKSIKITNLVCKK